MNGSGRRVSERTFGLALGVKPSGRRWWGFALLLLGACSVAADSGFVVESPTPAVTGGALVQDVGIETLGGVFTPILARGCRLPCDVSEVFGTADDGQIEILVHLYRGVAALTQDTHGLGTFRISGLRAMPRGQAQVKIRFVASTVGISILATEVGRDAALTMVRVGP